MESVNIDAIQYLCKVDINLEKIIKIVGKYSINMRNDPFQSLVESIIYQQLAGKAANAIYNRFINYYNNKQITPTLILNSPNDNVKGIGRWTSEMFLIFSLGRQDILPVTDLGVRKAIQKVYSLLELPKPNTMMEIAKPWKT